METLIDGLREFFTGDRAVRTVRAGILLVLAIPLARVAGGVIERSMARMLVPQQIALLRRFVSYGVVTFGFVMALRELGFDLSALLGAAGVLTVAVGFASQTVATNLISGLFLIGERGFEVGSLVTIGTTSGEVLSIDTLSMKMRTFDNVLVRIPNEALIKGEIRILTEFPIRRVDVALTAAYGDDLDDVEACLQDCADSNPRCLVEPAPRFLVLGFEDNGVDVQFSVWVQRDEFLDGRTAILRDIKRAFDRRGLRFPYPQRDVHLHSYDEKATVQAA